MTILSAQTIRRRVRVSQNTHSPITPDTDLSAWALNIEPFEPWSKKAFGLSYGVTAAGYDIRAGDLGKRAQLPDLNKVWIGPGKFVLIASLEHIWVPHDLQIIVHDKSTWARQGLAIQNTVLEPGWHGHITLELSNHSGEGFWVHRGQPIAQLVMHKLDEPTDTPYVGKYQGQGALPEEAKFDEQA